MSTMRKTREGPPPPSPVADRSAYVELEGLPNVGPAVAATLRLLGVCTPQDLPGRDPYVMYDELCRLTGKRHDPCLLDSFIAVVRFMGGEGAKPWWAYTAERKRAMEARPRPPAALRRSGRKGGVTGRSRSPAC